MLENKCVKGVDLSYNFRPTKNASELNSLAELFVRNKALETLVMAGW
jgi:hypothetical protein